MALKPQHQPFAQGRVDRLAHCQARELCREAQLAFGLQCAGSAVPLFSDARADNCRDLGVGVSTAFRQG
jgi:hypothetical protein